MKIPLSVMFCLTVVFVFSQFHAKLDLSMEMHDFGDIKEGKIVSIDLKLKNSGGVPLIIEKIITQCGCTTTDKPESPILPNDFAVIIITFDSSGKNGFVRKSITIDSNEETKVFVFTANIMR